MIVLRRAESSDAEDARTSAASPAAQAESASRRRDGRDGESFMGERQRGVPRTRGPCHRNLKSALETRLGSVWFDALPRPPPAFALHQAALGLARAMIKGCNDALHSGSPSWLSRSRLRSQARPRSTQAVRAGSSTSPSVRPSARTDRRQPVRNALRLRRIQGGAPRARPALTRKLPELPSRRGWTRARPAQVTGRSLLLHSAARERARGGSARPARVPLSTVPVRLDVARDAEGPSVNAG